jgi:hypothetical protein
MCGGSIKAQQDSTKSPAKNAIVMFWKEINKMKASDPVSKRGTFNGSLTTAETQIKNVKKQDPAYSTVSMQAAYDEQKKRFDDAESADKARHDEERNAVFGANKLKDSLFSHLPLMVNYSEPDLAQKNKETIEAYNATLSRFVAMKLDPASLTMASTERELSAEVRGVGPKLSRLADRIRGSWDSAGAADTYDEMVAMGAYWNAAQTIFPANSEFKSTHKMVLDSIASLGGKEKFGAIARKNIAERGRDVFLPKANQTNAALDADFRVVFTRNVPTEKITKVNITSTEWTIVRHPVTGVITGRTQTAAIASKDKDGFCVYHFVRIIQEYDGSKYLGSKMDTDVPQWIHCDNVK